MVCHVLDSLRLSGEDADLQGQRKERVREGEIVFISLTLFLGIASLFLKSSLEAGQGIAPFWFLSVTGRSLRTGHLFALLGAGDIWLLKNEHRSVKTLLIRLLRCGKIALLNGMDRDGSHFLLLLSTRLLYLRFCWLQPPPPKLRQTLSISWQMSCLRRCRECFNWVGC